jgi:hypothetical protein
LLKLSAIAAPVAVTLKAVPAYAAVSAMCRVGLTEADTDGMWIDNETGELVAGGDPTKAAPPLDASTPSYTRAEIRSIVGLEQDREYDLAEFNLSKYVNVKGDVRPATEEELRVHMKGLSQLRGKAGYTCFFSATGGMTSA